MQTLDMTNKVAVVTAGAAGIGGAAALLLAQHGATIVVADIDADEGTRTVQRIQALGREAIFIKADAMDKTEVAAAIQAADAHFGRIDVLVNNAGGVRRRNFLDQSERNWHRILDFNFVSMLAATQAAARLMIAGGRGGTIVNVASSEGLRGAPGYSVYAACKAAMINFTKTSALEFGVHGIRVNCIAPDLIMTPGLSTIYGPKEREAIVQISALARTGTPEEAANAILFLASPMSSFVTGATLSVDGGVIAAAGWSRSPQGDWEQVHIVP